MSTKPTSQEWIQIFKQRMESGLSIRKWCERNSISYDAYKYWEKKLEKLAPDIQNITEVTFVELPQIQQYHMSNPEYSYPLRIHCQDIMIDVSSSADQSQLAGILRLLRCGC